MDTETRVCAVSDVPDNRAYILASCHSLAFLDDNLVGDRLEMAVLQAVKSYHACVKSYHNSQINT